MAEIDASYYPPIPREMKDDLLKLSNELSKAIKSAFGECPLWYRSNRIWRTLDEIQVKKVEVVCGVENPCCNRRGEYNGYHSGPLLFECPKHCSCHD